MPRHVPKEDDDGEGSTEHHAKLVAADAPFGKEIVRLEDGRLVELERQLSETLVANTQRDRHIAQLTDELALKSALLKQAEANAAEEKKRAGLELRELQAKLDELLLSRDQGEANAAAEKKHVGLEQRESQAKLDELLLSRDHALGQAQSALQKATFRAAESTNGANENLQRSMPNSRRGSPNWRQSVYDSWTRRLAGPRARQRQTHCVPELRRRQASSIWMWTEL